LARKTNGFWLKIEVFGLPEKQVRLIEDNRNWFEWRDVQMLLKRVESMNAELRISQLIL